MSAKENTSLILRVPYWAAGTIVMIVIDAISFLEDNFQVMGNTLHDYDTVTRLAYLYQAMQRHTLGHGFFDRIDAPDGMVLHWTLPFNAFMIWLVKLFALVDPATALHYAGYWAGTILRLFVGPAAYWAGRQILTPAASGLASFLVLFSPYLLGYSHRGTANHHALMYLEAVILLGLSIRLVARPLSNLRLPLALGAMAALCLWTTFEMVIVVGPLFAVLFYLWIAEGEPRLRQLLLTTAAFSIFTTFALLIDAPYGGIAAPVLDHISMTFQTLAAAPFAIALGVLLLKPKTELRRAGYVFLAGLGCALAWLACYPFVLHGIQGAMDPYVVREWLGQIEEVKPVEEWRKLFAYLGLGLLASGLVFPWHAPRDRKEAVLLPLLFLYILGQLHFRFIIYDAVAAPYFLAYAYERIRRNQGEFPAHYTSLATPGALVVMALLITYPVSSLIVHYDLLSEPVKGEDVNDNVTCDPYLVRGPLNDVAWLGVGKADPIVVNEVNQAPKLLYWSNVRVVAGNYHRDSAGIKDDYTFFRDMGDDTAKAIAKRRGVDFVLLCGNGNDVNYSFETVEKEATELSKPGDEFVPEDTLYTRLSDQVPPPWLKLKPWPDDVDTDLLLYQVDRAMLDK